MFTVKCVLLRLATGTHCKYKKDKYIQIAFSVRRLSQRGHHAIPFRPYGKICTANFIGALAEKCDFRRRVIHIYNIPRAKKFASPD